MHFLAFCLTYHVKVINALKQDVWFSISKCTDTPLPYVLRNMDCNQVTTVSDTLSVSFHQFLC